MADETLTQLYTGAAWPNGYSVSNLMLLMDVTDLSMANTGTDKGITVANWLNQYFHAGQNITLASGPTGLTITSTVVAGVSSVFGRTGAILAIAGDYTVAQITGAAPLDSPVFTGNPTAPTATLGTSTAQIATTAFVQNSLPVVAVASVFGRTGAVGANAGDYIVNQVTGAAPISSPTFTGIPAAPTAIAGTSTTQLATTAFVTTAVAGVTIPVSSVFGRTGVVIAASGDYAVGQVTGAAPLASPTFTGVPAGPTATAGTSTTQLATTAFVSAAVAASPVLSVFGRTGAITATNGDYTVGQITGAASLVSPTFVGTPVGPTATPGTSTTQLATTAFVAAAVIAGVPVTSVFGRTGAIVPTGGDYSVGQITGAAPLASPALTGIPIAPTALVGTSTTQLATTAFVAAAIPSIPVTAVFGRTGAITATSGDYAVGQVTGAAPLASPTFTGVPAGPTATAGTNTTQLATTAFVATAIGGVGSVLSVFGRTGTVVASTGDYAVGQITGAAPLASPALTGTPTAPTATAGTNTTQIATTEFVETAIGGSGVVVSVFGRTGAVTATSGDYAVGQITGAAALASPSFTGVPTAPTATFGTNTTQLATTAFVAGAVAAGTGAITSVFGRVGVVIAASGDYAVAQVTGAASLASPTFTGAPSAPTATAGTNSTQLATTAFVATAVAAGGAVASVFGRTGAVVSTTGDYTVAQVTGAAPLASPTFTGTVTLPAGTVSLAQQANFPAARLMGNPTGSAAAPSAISLGTNLSFAGSVLNATGGGGGMTNPMTTLGDVIYEDSTPTAVRLAGNTTSTNKFLTQTGTGVVSAAPAWNIIAVGDIPALPASKITSGQIPVAQGGTGLGTLTANAVVLGNGTSTPGFATVGTAGRVLTDNGSGIMPSFAALPASMNNPMSVIGDLIYGTTSATFSTPGRLPIGSTNNVLTVASGLPSWAPINASNITTGVLPVAQHPTTGLKIDQSTSLMTLDTDGATITFNLALSNWHRVTLGGNRNLAVSGGTNGQDFTIVLDQDGVGNRVVSWFGGITWLSAPYFPVLGTAVGHTDIFRFKQTAIATYLGWQETGVTVPVGAYQGGTGLTSIAANAVLLGNGTGALQAATVGNNGYVLTDNGSGGIPTFKAPVTGTYVYASLPNPTSYAITTVYNNVGLSITLPRAGTYLISGLQRCQFFLNGAIGTDAFINSLVYDSTNAVIVPGTIALLLYSTLQVSSYGIPFVGFGSVPPVFYTVSGATTLQLQAKYTNEGVSAITGCYIKSDNNGLTSLMAIQVL